MMTLAALRYSDKFLTNLGIYLFLCELRVCDGPVMLSYCLSALQVSPFTLMCKKGVV